MLIPDAALSSVAPVASQHNDHSAASF